MLANFAVEYDFSPSKQAVVAMADCAVAVSQPVGSVPYVEEHRDTLALSLTEVADRRRGLMFAGDNEDIVLKSIQEIPP